MYEILRLLCDRSLKMPCYDCGMDYEGEDWIEAVIPDKIWNKISPTK